MQTVPFSLSVRSGYPDFLGLPWWVPLESWGDHCNCLVELPAGVSRHPVVFVDVEGRIFAIKELPPGVAEKEHQHLLQMSEAQIPVVRPVGHARTQAEGEGTSLLVTQYLEHSLPYRLLFIRSSLERYREHLLDAMAGLLVQLHLGGVFWGDCSLSNTLFRRDAGALTAYLVDAETAEIRPTLSERMRSHDLEIMEENLTGELADLVAAGALPDDFPVFETGSSITGRYQRLIDEVTREEVFSPSERYLIRERIAKLNRLGFSVGSIELLGVENGEQLKLKAIVTDRAFHRSQLHGLTGLEVEAEQARQMMNEIHELRADLSRKNNRSIPLSVASHHWLKHLYLPASERLSQGLTSELTPAERYCQMLEHKWYLSEQARQDVGHQAAVDSYLGECAKESSQEERGAAPSGSQA
ncbi:MAG: DUF4032 domain-containing protein [Bradymonadales bacterium]|nr:DUF4032 domain-containing protein [Bradymonadales bacterium]